MEHLIDSIKNFITALPPMLQLLFGLFATLGVIKLFMLEVDFIEDRREEKSKEQEFRGPLKIVCDVSAPFIIETACGHEPEPIHRHKWRIRFRG